MKVRESNFELLRIVCMIMIIMVHTLGHGGALSNINVGSTNFYVGNFLEAISIVAVNCYLLVSGFFGVNSKYKVSKVINIYLQVIFYSIVISSLFWIYRIEYIEIKSLIKTIFPIISDTWWFITKYLFLYILSPYINKLVKSLSFKEYNRLLILLTGIFVGLSSIIIIQNPIDNSGGYSLYYFIYLYIVGAYINIFFKNKRLGKLRLFIGYLIITAILYIFNIGMSIVLNRMAGIYSYNFMLIFISAVVLFLFFKELSIKSKIINKLASLSFGIYLIHDHPYVRNYIYKLLNYEEYFNRNTFFVYTIFIVICIYLICSMIEYIRQVLFKLIVSDKVEKLDDSNI